MKKVGIIGYGRFGRVLTDLLTKKYKVLVTDCNPHIDEEIEFSSLEEILECFLVFVAVPIRSFEAVVQEISQYKLYNVTIVDVCSVKVFPVQIMKALLLIMWGLLPLTLILDLILTLLSGNLK